MHKNFVIVAILGRTIITGPQESPSEHNPASADFEIAS
jgi:hypothetical protein